MAHCHKYVCMFQGHYRLYVYNYVKTYYSRLQEKELLKELREKLSKSELKIVRLENENAQLQDELSHTEDKYKQCKKENK